MTNELLLSNCVIFEVESPAMSTRLGFLIIFATVSAVPLWAAPPVATSRCFEDLAQQICVPGIASTAVFSPPSKPFYFPAFEAAKFNKGAGFGGPNCFNSALIASGGLLETELRYVGSSEFELILQNNYRLVSEQERKPGDIVVFDAEGGRSHAAVLFGQNLIFQKKGFLRHYLYRIVPLDETMTDEPGEWVPGPFDQIPGSGETYLNSAPRAYYRIKDGVKSVGKFTELELQQLEVVAFLKRSVLMTASGWKVGRELGLVTEELIPRLVTEFSQLARHPSYEARLAFETLRSLGDQVFQSIEESHFSSNKMSENRRAQITAEICYAENGYLRELLPKLMKLSGKDSSPASVEAVVSKLRTMDRSACRMDLMAMLR